MATIEIDGKQIEINDGAMIIQAADQADIYIPRFCYHKKLSIAANCRMCLVQVGESPKAMPACATPVANGMKVYTKSEVALKAQKTIMEFLLINHPLDCPICDQGGQCELQDLAMGYGRDVSRYNQGKRVIKDKNIGSLIHTDMTRCIHCTRCVRFGQEIAGQPELGVLNRGEHEEIGTFVEHMLDSELSGNMVELCPVGALVAKPSLFTARAWELQQRLTISPHDCVGSHLHAHILRDQVKRVVPRENEATNEMWISNRDRFSYEALRSPDRLGHPMIKRKGEWQEVDWLTALEFTTEKLQKTLNGQGANHIAGIISPSATVEEHYLWQKLLRGVGCNNIDHRIHEIDFRDQTARDVAPTLGMKFTDVEQLQICLLIGANVQKDQPVLAPRFRNMVKRGGQLLAVTPHNGCQNLIYQSTILTIEMAKALAGIAKALGIEDDLLTTVTPTEAESSIAEQLRHHEKIAIILGQLALSHHDAAVIRYLAQLIAAHTHASFGELTLGANVAGGWIAGCVPHRQAAGMAVAEKGFDVQAAFAEQLAAYLLLGIEPELDCANPQYALDALKNAEFVAVISSYIGERTLEYADVILPLAPFTETSGTYINMQGDWQSFSAVAKPFEDVRPGWKILRVLGNFLKVENFNYNSSQEVRDEIKNLADNGAANIHKEAWAKPQKLIEFQGLQRVAPWFMYRIDSTVRRSAPLQASPNNICQVVISSHLAEQLNLLPGDKAVVTQHSGHATLTVKISDKLADNAVLIANGFIQTSDLGAPSDRVEVSKC